jgi:hypothetical protein
MELQMVDLKAASMAVMTELQRAECLVRHWADLMVV